TRRCASHSALRWSQRHSTNHHGRFIPFATRQYGIFWIGKNCAGGKRRNSVDQWAYADIGSARNQSISQPRFAATATTPVKKTVNSGHDDSSRTAIGFCISVVSQSYLMD